MIFLKTRSSTYYIYIFYLPEQPIFYETRDGTHYSALCIYTSHKNRISSKDTPAQSRPTENGATKC